jgi:hypothetical protein
MIKIGVRLFLKLEKLPPLWRLALQALQEQVNRQLQKECRDAEI